GRQHAGRDVFRHHGARADDGAVADAHARQDDGTAAGPDVVADVHGLGRLEARTAGRGLQRVGGRVDVHARAEQHVAADVHFRGVENHAVKVEKHSVAQVDVGAVVAVK